MRRTLLLLLTTLLLLSSCGRKATVTELTVLPEPVFMVKRDGSFNMKHTLKISISGLGQNASTTKYIMRTLRHSHMRPKLVTTRQNSDIDLVVNDTANTELGDEGYIVEIRSNGIRLSANTETGLFYAFQTLLQLLPADITEVSYRSVTLPECTILDYPRCEWRGAHLDVSRHFFPVKFVKKYLDLMASYKMNRFHFHLTDDHGWRLPSEHWPQLNEIGSWRVDREDVPWGEAEPAHEGERASYGGFYSHEELAEIIQYAAERCIEVIPEVDFPGHVSAVLASYPQLACDNYNYQVALGPYWPPKAILCAGNDSTLVFLKQTIDELCDIFPSQYIHIGGDEALKENWEQCPKCQRRIRAEHLGDEEHLQGWLMKQIQDYMREKRRTAIVWDDAIESAMLEHDAIVMSWRGIKPGLHAAVEGHKVIMCPTDYCYLDYYQADKRYQPAAIGGHITLATAYSFNPIPLGTNSIIAGNILGGQCNLWTEYINTPAHAEYMLLPRLIAISECLWSQPERKNWNSFRRKIEDEKERLQIHGYNYCEGSFTPQFTARRVDDHTMNISISTEVPNTYIFYTTDGSTPTHQSSIYLGPVNLKRGTHIKILPVYKSIERDSVYEFVIK